MGAISKSVPNFFGGVSQQASPSRHISQCTSLVNADPSIADGLGKRAPTEHIAALVSAAHPANSFVHFINRDSTNQFVLVISTGAIYVYDMAGVAQTILAPDGTGYLTSSNPQEQLAAVTVADYTFIVNKTVAVALSAAVGAGVLTGTVQQFSALPGAPAVNAVYRIEGTPSTNFDDYYVKWNGTVWVETVLPGIQNTFDAATLPFKLTKTGASTFTFQKNVWADRLVGDTASNPVPSLVGQTISDVFFYRNRLGFLADENAILSRSGDPFNFWAETVTAALDSDPIDVGANTNFVAILRFAVAFNKSLMLFSNKGQFQFSGADTLTPKSAKLDATTEFEASTVARPCSSGNSLFFAVPQKNATSMREYYVDQDTVSNDAADITAHVPSFVPTGVFQMRCSTAKDVMVALSNTKRNALYVYKFYWSGNEKVQSAWHEWTIDEGAEILGCDFMSNTLYLVVRRGSVVALEKMVLDRQEVSSGLTFKVLLDRLVSLTGVYDAGNNWTTWTLPYSEAGTMTVVQGSAFGVDSGNSLQTTRPSSMTIRAAGGDYTAGACWVGRNYTLSNRLSTLFVRDDKGVAVLGGSLTLQDLRLWLENSGYLKATVTIRGRTTPYTYEWTGKEIGAVILGELSIEDGVFSFPLGALNTHVTIDLTNDSYLPCNIIMGEWDGNYTSHKART